MFLEVLVVDGVFWAVSHAVSIGRIDNFERSQLEILQSLTIFEFLFIFATDIFLPSFETILIILTYRKTFVKANAAKSDEK